MPDAATAAPPSSRTRPNRSHPSDLRASAARALRRRDAERASAAVAETEARGLIRQWGVATFGTAEAFYSALSSFANSRGRVYGPGHAKNVITGGDKSAAVWEDAEAMIEASTASAKATEELVARL